MGQLTQGKIDVDI